jgi:hypothetical protein
MLPEETGNDQQGAKDPSEDDSGGTSGVSGAPVQCKKHQNASSDEEESATPIDPG